MNNIFEMRYELKFFFFEAFIHWYTQIARTLIEIELELNKMYDGRKKRGKKKKKLVDSNNLFLFVRVIKYEHIHIYILGFAVILLIIVAHLFKFRSNSFQWPFCCQFLFVWYVCTSGHVIFCAHIFVEWYWKHMQFVNGSFIYVAKLQ